MRHWLTVLLLLVGPPALAQQAVPSIAFELGAQPASAANQHVFW